MSSLFKKILRNFSTRVLTIVFALVIIIVVFFLSNSYFSQLKIYKEKELTKLKSIANTLSLQIDGQKHDMLFMDYTEMDAIKAVDQIDCYYEIHNILINARNINELNTTIYTMVFNPPDSTFLFGVSTSDEPFYRHPYTQYPDELLKNYEIGGTISPYEDENGTWLSAFAPLKNDKKETIGVIQVDEQFDIFIQMVRSEILKNSIFSLIIISIISLVLIRVMRKILLEEENISNQMIAYNTLIEEKNNDITSSIRYAKKIQDAVYIPYENLQKYIPDSFIFYKPRDIVSGDFYWTTRIDNKIIVAAVDCTGHGVPGAFMSLIGNILLKDIVNVQKITKPSEILKRLNKEVKNALNTQEGGNYDGMDMALCSLDLTNKQLEFAGAMRPLVYIRNDEIYKIKGDRVPIGGRDIIERGQKFTNHILPIIDNDLFIIFTDGITDQFGGKNGKKYLMKNFNIFLSNNKLLKAKEIRKNLATECVNWKGDQEQIDDVLVIGFRINL